MAKPTQANRALAVHTPLGPDALLLVKLSGTEAISRPFRFRLDMLAEQGTPVPFERLLGHDVTAEIHLEGPPHVRYVSGIVARVSQGRRVRSGLADATAPREESLFIRYHADVVPRLWLLRKRVQSRIFQHQSVPDILRHVFKNDWQLDVRGLDSLRGPFYPRDYCVQYRESDFAFVSRLMEEEGICYFFEHTRQGHTLVLANTPVAHPDVAEPSTVTYEELTGGLRPSGRVTGWEKSQTIRSTAYTLWDYCFELPGQNLQAGQRIQPTAEVGKVQHSLGAPADDRREIYEWPGGYAQRFDGIDRSGGVQAEDLSHIFEDNARTARIRMEQEAAGAVRVRGRGKCAQFTAGYKFSLARHFDGDGPYVLTEVEHAADIEGTYTTKQDVPLNYANRFTCIPFAVPYRPRRKTPRPRALGTQTATVVGPPGSDIFLDKYGRIKVRFHWDRHAKENADGSCWIRVGQVWAGKRWGAFFWPRVGNEVIVAFEGGDPDQPVVVGSVYNAANMPPFELPDEAMVGGLKSCSFGASADPLTNFNGVAFYDAPGKEHLQLHSEKHEIFNSESTRYTHVGQSSYHVVGGLHLPGSGSGGGSGGPEPILVSSGSGGGDLDWQWAKTDYAGTLGDNSAVAFGESYSVYVPYYAEHILGSCLMLVINPLGFAANFGQDPGAGVTLGNLPALAKGLGAIAGNLTFVIGTNNTLNYGPSIGIHRGSTISLNSTIAAGLGLSALAAATATVYFAGAAVPGFLPKESERLGMALGSVGVASLMLYLLNTLEVKEAYVETAAAKAAEAAALAQKIQTGSVRVARGIALAASDRSQEALQLVANAGAMYPVRPAPAPDSVHTYRMNYTINAYDITLNSVANPPVPPGQNLPGATSINISAQGQGPGHTTGTLNLSGTQQVSLFSGAAALELVNSAGQSTALLHYPMGGSLTLQLDNVPAPIQFVQLTQDGITIKDEVSEIKIVSDGEMVTIQSGAGPTTAKITVEADGSINLEGASITLQALNAINLSVDGGANQVQVNNQGVTIQGLTAKIAAEVQAQLEAIQAEEEAAEWINQIELDIFQ
jgi:type VI secretion system secreted protein VgrG